MEKHKKGQYFTKLYLEQIISPKIKELDFKRYIIFHGDHVLLSTSSKEFVFFHVDQFSVAVIFVVGVLTRESYSGI